MNSLGTNEAPHMAAEKAGAGNAARAGDLLRRAGTSYTVQVCVIAAGLAAMTLYSTGDLNEPLQITLRVTLVSCLSYFAAEWAAKLALAARIGRVRAYWSSGAWIIDALAVLPVPMALALGIPGPTAWLLGSLWLFKLALITPGLARLGRVITLEAKALFSVLIIFFMVLFFSAVSVHLLEREAQPGAFGTLPAALWWAVATLTTTGYGDAVPVTDAGRVIASFVMICGLGVFGLLTGILATGFVDESRRETFVENWNVVKNVPFFQALEPAGLIEIARMLRRWDVSEGTVVIRRGREGDCMYFVASGEVEVEVTPPVRLGPGAFFGELALLGSGVRNATVTAVRPSTLLILDAPDFRMFAAHHPALIAAIEAEARRRAGARSPQPPPPAH